MIAKNIIDFICEKYKIKETELFSDSIKRNTTNARNACMRLLYEKLNMTISEIATLFNRSIESIYAQIATTKKTKSKKEEFQYIMHLYRIKFEGRMTLDEKIHLLSPEKRAKILNILNS